MRQQTALVLDDNSICRFLLAEIMKERNIKVSAYADPVSCLEKHLADLEKQPFLFDFILTDNQMPGMTGLEFLQKLQEKGVALRVERVAVISGNWSEQELQQARSLGCRIFAKPCDISRLHEWIDTVLKERP